VIASIAADSVLAIHFLFIVFAVLGGLLLLRYRWVIWLHVPAMIWAAMISFRHDQFWRLDLPAYSPGKHAASRRWRRALYWRLYQPLPYSHHLPGRLYARTGYRSRHSSSSH